MADKKRQRIEHSGDRQDLSIVKNRRRFLRNGLAGIAVAGFGVGAPRAWSDNHAPSGVAKQKIAVLGGTGRTGKFVVDQLLDAGHSVRSISRRPGDREAQPGYEWVAGDVTKPDTLAAAVDGADALIYAVGVNFTKVETQTLYDVYDTGVQATASAAKSAGLKRFILLSSAGSVPRDQLPPMFRPSMDAKTKGENALRASGIEYTISRTAGLWDRPGGEHGILFYQSEDPPPGGPFMICREDSAKVLVECAITGSAAYKTFIPINAVTPEIDSWREALAMLEEDPVSMRATS